MSAPEQTRPEEILRAFSARRRPGDDIWRYFERCRTGRDWPAWCYVPVGAAQVYIAHEVGLRDFGPAVARLVADNPDAVLSVAYDACIAASLAGWRMGRGIYRFDPDFSAALTATPLSGDVPVEVLYQLPEWAVYVEMHHMPPVQGVLASLEWDSHRAEAEMRLFFDTGDPAPTLLPLPLTAGTIADMLGALRARMRGNAERLGVDPADLELAYSADGALGGIIQDALPAAVNLLLYLCSPEAEYRGGERPKRPEPVKTRRGTRLFPASEPRVWHVGEETGARLRQASAARRTPEERNAPRPHLRRAHWHTYRTGKGREGYRVRWLHPILVGYGGDNGVQGDVDLPGDAPGPPGQVGGGEAC